MADKVLITLPDGYKNPSLRPSYWPGTETSACFTRHNSEHLSGNTFTDNNSPQTLGENVNCARTGSLYTDSEGFRATVSTKSTSNYYSKHFIGHDGGNTISSGSTVGSYTQSTWLQNVIGFHCEVSSIPIGSGSEADNCGVCEQTRICAVYSDSGRQVRILEMTAPGVKLSTQKYNENAGKSWTILAYSLNQTDSMKVVNGNWRLYGWIVEYKHKKICGGNGKTKNCTGRIRYLRPIVSSNGYNGLSLSLRDSVIVYNWETTLSNVTTLSPQILQVV